MIHALRDILLQYIDSDNLALGFSIAIATSGILILCYLADFITKKYLVKLLRIAIIRVSVKWATPLLKHRTIHYFSQLAPALVVYILADVYNLSDIPATATLVAIIKKAMLIFMLAMTAFIINAFIDSINYVYNTYSISKIRPIKSYLQVLKLIFFVILFTLIIATLVNESPLAFFTGIGAAAAIISLIFKDSILGFVTSIQLTVYDMVRISDWIEMPDFGADGKVVDISLNTVKVENFDKTITTIPTYALMSHGIKNWRGMQEAGGRRIKRCIILDMKSVKFCDNELLQRLRKINILSYYISEKLKEIDIYNKNIKNHDLKINGRGLTNIGCYRKYISAYLQNNSNIHQQGFTFLVRQLQPSENGLPLEIYSFSRDTTLVGYEQIQANLIDHLLAALPLFDLRVYQRMSGTDLENLDFFKKDKNKDDDDESENENKDNDDYDNLI